jgi:hypothetical protein
MRLLYQSKYSAYAGMNLPNLRRTRMTENGAYVTNRGEEQMSLLIGIGGFIPAILSIWALLRVGYFGDFQIDTLTADLLTLAGVIGMPVFVFGAWMCMRRIGLIGWGVAALALGGLGVSAWPLSNYISSLGT